MKLFFASGNPHKAAELQSLADAGAVPVQIVSARVVGGMPAVEEDTGTFVGNARKKVLALRSRLPADAWVLADDSGVCVDALGGEPGVPETEREAQFRCVLLVGGPDGAEEIFEGQCGGRLLLEPRGGAGFGYDPLFVPHGYTETYAELGDAVKNRISHRAQAWGRLAEWIRTRGR